MLASTLLHVPVVSPPLAEGGDALSPGLGIPLAVALILINGFFVASEFALVKVRHSRLEELAEAGSRRAAATQDILRRLDFYLAASQLGITVASLALGWVGEPVVAGVLSGPLTSLGLDAGLIGIISVAVGFLLITALHIAFGEQVPKMLAIARPESWAMFVSPGLRVFSVVAHPAIVLLNRVSNLTVRVLGVDPAALKEEAIHSDQELQLMLAVSGEHGLLDPIEQELAANALELGDRSAAEIMTPRVSVDALADTLTLGQARAIAVHSGHDRLPVYRETIDDITGVVEWRDLYRSDDEAWAGRARPVPYVPETASASLALARMRTAGTEMAVVVDEYGGTAGIITLRTFFEQVAGQDTGWEPSREIPGGLPLRVVEELLDSHAGEVEASTVAGYIFEKLGRPAVVGDHVPFGRWMLTVERIAPDRNVVAAVRASEAQTD